MASELMDPFAANDTWAPQRGGSIGGWLSAGHAGERRFAQLLALLELVLAVGLIQLVLWPLAESSARVPACCMLASLCVWSVWRNRKQFRGNIAQRKSASWAWTVTIGASLALAGLLIAGAWSLGILGSDELLRLPTRQWRDWLGVKLPTVGVQQVMLQWFFLPLALILVAGSNAQSTARRRVAVLICGMVFAMVHWPNTLLVLLTFAAGTVWCTLYLAHRRVAPLIASHLLLAVLASNVGHVHLLKMSVGSRCVPLLPKTITLADGQTLRTMPGVVAGYIDACQSRGEKMSVHGWIVDVRSASIPDQLIICINGQRKHAPIEGTRTDRPGVVRLFHDPSIARCGFRVDLPIEWFAAENEVRFLGRSTDGIVSELDYNRKYQWAGQ